TYDKTDRFGGVMIADVELSQGLNIGRGEDADQFPSRSDGRVDFTKAVVEIGRLQRIIPRLNLAASVRGQYSPAGLLSSEEFAVGGSRYGRGYDPAEISGDNGVAGKVELQYSPPVQIDGLDRLQVYAFYDLGKVWNYGDDDQIDPRLADAYLSSAGVGVRYQLLDVISGDVEVAQPLSRGVASGSGKSTRVFFSLSVDY
ncbi:MAG: ShlB/FhaC/HecB family hemolysin secretion/activation protein, partial [Pseudomonadota bacterium]